MLGKTYIVSKPISDMEHYYLTGHEVTVQSFCQSPKHVRVIDDRGIIWHVNKKALTLKPGSKQAPI